MRAGGNGAWRCGGSGAAEWRVDWAEMRAFFAVQRSWGNGAEWSGGVARLIGQEMRARCNGAEMRAEVRG